MIEICEQPLELEHAAVSPSTGLARSTAARALSQLSERLRSEFAELVAGGRTT